MHQAAWAAVYLPILTFLVFLPGTTLKADDAEQVLKILETHCADCHADGANEGGFDDVNKLPELVKSERVLPGNAVQSPLYARVFAGEMPPQGEEPTGERPTSAETELLANWIRAGAPDVGSPSQDIPDRPFVSMATEMQAIEQYLNKLPRSQRRFQRFFSLRNVHNNKKRNAAELDTYRAAFGKAINSLTWRGSIQRPTPVGEHAITYAVNLRDLGWDGETWDSVLSNYPYGLRHSSLPRSREHNETATSVYHSTETEVPVLRIDWFVVTATRPPLYHTLLGIPKKLQMLEHRIGVDAQRNLNERQVARAGVTQSGVSEQHRLIERHEGRFGYYWKSYDFGADSQRSNLVRFPLGPQGPRNPFTDLAFEHDGGEFIFRLSNGLQGYMLSDAAGNRLDGAAPIEIVSDRSRISGNVQIFNGISCMGCHTQGIIKIDDVIRGAANAQGEALEFLEDIYPTKAEMDRHYAADIDSFRSATLMAMKAMTLDDSWLEKPDGSIVEPILAIVKFYTHHPLYLEDVAAELDIEPADFRAALRFEDRLSNVGLGILKVEGEAIKRRTWEEISASGRSSFQRAANMLKLGEPIVVTKDENY